MITKIISNNLTERTSVLPQLVQALVGSWGINGPKESQNVFIGRSVISYFYDGKTIKNPSESYKAIAVIAYIDGSSEIAVIGKNESVELDKAINMAVLMAQTI